MSEQQQPERKCQPFPIGCGLTIGGFDDALSEKEFGISGLCQPCQNNAFREDDEDDILDDEEDDDDDHL